MYRWNARVPCRKVFTEVQTLTLAEWHWSTANHNYQPFKQKALWEGRIGDGWMCMMKDLVKLLLLELELVVRTNYGPIQFQKIRSEVGT